MHFSNYFRGLIIMKFSVVITTYNYSKFLYRCVTSVINQNHIDSEILIVDDGSTDNTKIIVATIKHEYPNKSVKYIWQENAGVSSARNHGLAEANGEYIWFLDADDYLMNNSLQFIGQHISNNPNIDMLFGGYAAIYKDKIVDKYPSELSPSRHTNFKNFIKKNIRGITIGATIIRKPLLHKYIFPENIQVGEDFVLISKVLAASNQCFSLQEIIVNKRRDSESSLRNNHSKGATSQINCVEALFGDPNLDKKYKKYKNYFISTKYLPASRSYYYIENYKKSVSCYLAAISKYPLAIFRIRYLNIFIKSLYKLIKTSLITNSKLTFS